MINDLFKGQSQHQGLIGNHLELCEGKYSPTFYFYKQCNFFIGLNRLVNFV